MKKVFVLLLLVNIYTLFASDNLPWPAMRGTQEGGASIILNESLSFIANEWEFRPNTDRKYSSYFTVWTSAALAVIKNRPMAFIGGYDQKMYALDIDSQKVVWNKITNGPITNAPVIGRVNGREIIYWGSSDRSVYAYDAANGQRLWNRELVEPTSTIGTAHLSSPYIVKTSLLITCFTYDKSISRNEQKGRLFVLCSNSGTIKYKIDIVPGAMSSPVGFNVDDRNYVVIAAQRGFVTCLEVTNDEPYCVWNFQMPHEVLGSPVITNEAHPILFLGSKYGNLIAIDALTGKEVWQKMTGNWIDNTGCIGEIDNQKIIYVGSHDYKLYAFNAHNGDLIWSQKLGGEVYSAPCFFNNEGKKYVAAATLDNNLNILSAKTGSIEKVYLTGNPLWESISKGENLWGSPTVIEAGHETSIIHGSYNGTIYVLPINKKSELSLFTYRTKSLWLSILIVIIVFCGIIIPVLVNVPLKKVYMNK